MARCLHRVGILSPPDTIIRRGRVAEPLADDSHSPEPNLAVQESVVGAGKGLFAQTRIARFECLLRDEALLSLEQGEDLVQLCQKYDLLSPDHQQAFDALCSRHDPEADRLLALKLKERGLGSDLTVSRMIATSNTFLANAFNFADPLEAQGNYQGVAPIFRRALFPTVARINHCCTPNAHVHYRREIGSMLVYALCDIEPGEEITIAYFNVTMARDSRQARARDWGFACHCPACTGNGSVDHEQTLAVIRGALQLNANVLIVDASMLGAEAFLARIDSTKDVIEVVQNKPSLLPQLPELYEQLALLQTRAQDLGVTSADYEHEKLESYRLALAASVDITGIDSPFSRRRKQLLRTLG